MRVLATVLALIFVTTLFAVNPYASGPCTNHNRGKIIVVKDRISDDKIMVCIRGHQGKYQWHVINGTDIVNTQPLPHIIGTCEDVKVRTHGSCKQIWTSQSNKGSGVYQISVGNNKFTDVYCQMTSVAGCHGGGWTMVMKIDGSLSTFGYSSSYWTSTNTYSDNAYGRNGGLDNRQYKGSTYWRTSFKEICVGMKYGGSLRAFSFSYPATSLYDLIADGNYRQTHVGREQWKSLIYGSSLQRHCNREGFNIQLGRSGHHPRVRFGLVGNEQNNCNSPDSFVGLGADGGLDIWPWCDRNFRPSANAAGNLGQCTTDNGNKNARAMAYILVR